MKGPITILLADDHALVRSTLASCLASTPGLQVITTVSDAGQAVTECLKSRPDIVVFDIDMPGVSSFEAARTIRMRCPDTRVLFLSAFHHDRYIEQALAVEASGYVTKSEPPETLVQAIHAAASGSTYFSQEVLDRLVVTSDGTSLAGRGTPRASTLTERELEVLRYLTRGLAKKEIAALMHISLNTVNRHTDSLMAKLDIHDRVQLARFAIREGLAEV